MCLTAYSQVINHNQFLLCINDTVLLKSRKMIRQVNVPNKSDIKIDSYNSMAIYGPLFAVLRYELNRIMMVFGSSNIHQN